VDSPALPRPNACRNSPHEPDAYVQIETVARNHLAYTDASRALRAALQAIEDVAERNEVESAVSRVRGIGDTAYYYAGLACGVVSVLPGYQLVPAPTDGRSVLERNRLRR
jgi:hypothetical protein